MIFKKLFPCALVACFALSLMSTSASAQTSLERPRQVTTVSKFNGDSTLVNDFQIISEASPAAIKSAERMATSSTLRFNQTLMSAIDSRLGSRYVWGASGPHVFDCSGFVWSSFNEIGINFTRVSARHLWATFQPAREDEKFQFGTLVFFSGLTHVGIVADANGFYHASRRHGVVYAPFNKYWLSRIDGFRRVPLASLEMAE
jgi:cell wall-associated NlpC family hydrolase